MGKSTLPPLRLKSYDDFFALIGRRTLDPEEEEEKYQDQRERWLANMRRAQYAYDQIKTESDLSGFIYLDHERHLRIASQAYLDDLATHRLLQAFWTWDTPDPFDQNYQKVLDDLKEYSDSLRH